MKYHYRREYERDASGPVTFRQLVLVVSAGNLGPNDKVLADGEKDWSYAADVPGLFHMAGRDNVVSDWCAQEDNRSPCTSTAIDSTDIAEVSWESDNGFGFDELDALLSSQESLAADADVVEEPAWRQRLRLVEAQRAEQSDSVGLVSRVTTVASEALAELDQRIEIASRSRRISNLFSDVFSVESLKLAVRVVFAVLAANSAAFWLISWSDTQSQRFPDKQMLASGIREFPLYGSCSPGEFMFLTIDVMMAAGIAGYFISRKLEAISDD